MNMRIARKIVKDSSRYHKHQVDTANLLVNRAARREAKCQKQAGSK